MADILGLPRGVGSNLNDRIHEVNRNIMARNALAKHDYDIEQMDLTNNITGAKQAEATDEMADREKEGAETLTLANDLKHAAEHGGKVVKKGKEIGGAVRKSYNALRQASVPQGDRVMAKRPRDIGEPEGVELQEASAPSGETAGIRPGSSVARFGEVNEVPGVRDLTMGQARAAERTGIQSSQAAIQRYTGLSGDAARSAGEGRTVENPATLAEGTQPEVRYEAPEATDGMDPAAGRAVRRAAFLDQEGQQGGRAADMLGNAGELLAKGGGGAAKVADVSSKATGALDLGLRGLNVVSGGIDIADDIRKKGIAGKDLADKISNVSGGISGGLEAVGLGLDATGLGAALGVPLQLIGAAAGATSLVSGIIGDFSKEGGDKKAVKSAQGQSVTKPTMDQTMAYQSQSLAGTYAGKADSQGKIQGTGAF